jgi:hypothetical protein
VALFRRVSQAQIAKKTDGKGAEPMIKNANTDLIAGLLGLGITAAFWFSLDPEMTRLSNMFPKAMIRIMGLISVLLVIRSFLNPDRRNLFAEGSNRRVLVTAVHFFAWGMAIPRAGFFVSSVVVISSLVYYLALANRRVSVKVMSGWVLIIVFEVSFFYLIFTRLLHIPLPSGFLI